MLSWSWSYVHASALVYKLRFASEDVRASANIVYVNYAQGCKNTVTVDSNWLSDKFELPLFGQVVLEAGPKQSYICASCLQPVVMTIIFCCFDETETCVFCYKVASAVLGGQTVRFYLSPAGHDKPSAAAPCAAYMIKGVVDDAKAPPLLNVQIKQATVKFHVACLALQNDSCHVCLV